METSKIVSPMRPKLALPLVLSVQGVTYASRFNDDFVDQVVIELRQALMSFVGGVVELNVYSAPWAVDEQPQGQLTLRLSRGNARVAEIGIVFGAPDESADVPHRRLFDREAFEHDPTNPHASGIFLASFDECWLCCCRVLQDLSPSTVHFSFGT